MKQLFLFLNLLVFTAACSTVHDVSNKKINITVFDKNTNLPVDSARVVLTKIVESRDIYTYTKYTDATGQCSFPLTLNSSVQYQVGCEKEGLLSYFDESYADLIRSFAFVNENTGDNLVLYLTSDSMNHINYWAKRSSRYDIDTLIHLLKSNSYPDRMGFPALVWEDIPGLLTIGNDNTLVNKYPENPLSSGYMKDCYLGVISLWFIESTRITVLNKIYDPMQKFPSMTPALRYKDNPEVPASSIETMETAFHAYKSWWEKIKNMDKEQGCKINPLENTNLEWR